MAQATKIGIVGCGNISHIYFKAGTTYSADIEIAACCDLVPDRAREKAEEFGVPKVCTTEELLADPEIEIVVNLTTPNGHAAVALAALEAGKSVYNEKPLTITREDAARLLELAGEKGLRVGCAPDTFLGAGLQTCRKLIDDGVIGDPIAASAAMMCHGHESWHPDPEFYYQTGGGPMFDMGPYYLTALVSLLGPVRRVTGSTRITFPERTITSEKKNGQKIEVEVPTHIAGVLDFASGAVGTITTTFDVWAANQPRLDIYGTTGSISAPDPNGFGGEVRVWEKATGEWRDVPWTHAENHRGIGVADMARAIRNGRPERAGGRMACHVLDLMHAFHDASDAGAHVELTTTCERPAPIAPGLEYGVISD